MRTALTTVVLIFWGFLAGGCATGFAIRLKPSPSLTLNGRPVAESRSRTAQEVVAMLGVERECRVPSVECAARIMNEPGPIRRATRLVVSSEILHAASKGRDATDAALACALQSHIYLFEPGVPGRPGPVDSRTQLALLLHNACTETLLRAAPASAIRWNVDGKRFPRVFVRSLIPSHQLPKAGLRTLQVDDGIGVAAVAIGRVPHELPTFPRQPFALAVNIRFEPEGPGGYRLVVSDASSPGEIDTAFGRVALARDVTRAFAAAGVEFERELTAWGAVRRRDTDAPVADLRLLSPADPGKTPVILIHGLLSSPATWSNVANELLGDPEISRHYQIWLARYSTGLPLLVNRQNLATRISTFYQTSFPTTRPRLVLIGHSMGGVLARLLVTSSGSTLWDTAMARQDLLQRASPLDVAAAQQLFHFSRLSNVDTAIFVAAPHAGSQRADGWLARASRTLISPPTNTLAFLARIAKETPNALHPDLTASFLRGGPTSLDTLSPKQPVIRATYGLPVDEAVDVYSIAGIRHAHKPYLGDGVVTVESALWWQGAQTIVPGPHELHTVPATVLEIKSILLSRLAGLSP